MTSLTWKKFKELVDSEMKEKNIDENTPIWYIDISWPVEARSDLTIYKVPIVNLDKSSGLEIS